MDTKKLLLIGGGAAALWWFFMREDDSSAAPAASGGGGGASPPPAAGGNGGAATPPLPPAAKTPDKVVVVMPTLKEQIFKASGNAPSLNADNWNYYYQQVTGKAPLAYEDIVPEASQTANRGPNLTVEQYAGLMQNAGRGLTGGWFNGLGGGLSGLFPDYEDWAV